MSEQSSLLPLGCILRHAFAKDIWQIRKLVFSEKLDPTQLRWQQFWVIESEGNLVACGQLRNFPGVQELSSLVGCTGLAQARLRHFFDKASNSGGD